MNGANLVITAGFGTGSQGVKYIPARGFMPLIAAPQAKQKPFIERVPEMTSKVSDRARRATEKVSVTLNSLYGQTYIEQTGQASYKLHGGAWEAARPPGVNDDLSKGVQTGNIWVDTSASPRKFYVCVDNSGFTAVWNGPY